MDVARQHYPTGYVYETPPGVISMREAREATRARMEAEAAIAAHLRAARTLIDKPKKWAKAISAVNKHGVQVPCDDPTAIRFGMPGALRATARLDDGLARDDAYNALAAVLADSGVILQVFNDSPKTTHADVLAVFDAAIARLEVRRLWDRLEL